MYNKSRMHTAPVSFSNLFDGFFGSDWRHADHDLFKPSVNIKETEDQFEIHMVAPGLQKDQFDIQVDKNILSVSFEQKSENNENQDNWIRQEYGFRSFKRSFTLNEKMDASQIKAAYDNGILKLSIPKKDKEAQQKIAISVQ